MVWCNEKDGEVMQCVVVCCNVVHVCMYASADVCVIACMHVRMHVYVRCISCMRMYECLHACMNLMYAINACNACIVNLCEVT